MDNEKCFTTVNSNKLEYVSNQLNEWEVDVVVVIH